MKNRRKKGNEGRREGKKGGKERDCMKTI